MTVDRTIDQDGPATLSIFFVPPSSSTKPAAPTSSTSKETATSDHIPADRVESIDMKHKKESEILEQLLRLTGAKVVTPTAREQEELDELAEQRGVVSTTHRSWRGTLRRRGGRPKCSSKRREV